MRYGSNYWEAFSPKMHRNIKLFSDLEYDHWLLLESDSNVTSFCEQPLRINHFYNGEIVESIFDMWVKYRDGSECFIEVKYSNELDPNNPRSKRSLRQTAVQRDWCHCNGHLHIIKTEIDIRRNPIYLSNLKQIISYIKNRSAPIETDQFKMLQILKRGLITLQNIEGQDHGISQQRIRESLFWLIYQGKINSNIDHCIIGPSLEVWMNVETKDC